MRIVLVLSLLATPAFASDRIFDCAFLTECMDAECQPTTYAGSLSANTASHSGHWSDDAETIDLAVGEYDGVLMASEPLAQSPTQRMITILADGAVRYTVHVSDPNLTNPPLALTYIGHCKEAT